MEDCIFCKILSREVPGEIVYEDDDFLGFKDINPQAPEHLLFIPKKHISGPAAMGEEDEQLIGKVMRIGAELATENGIGDNFRVVFNNGEGAGQTVFHIHMHVLGGRSMTWPPG